MCLISIVVPTKNRYSYLKYLIKLIDNFRLSELELVIQDNSDNNAEILQFLKNFDNKQIKYFYSSDKLSMSENADKAVSHSRGEYVCMIGDDDGVCRNIVNCVHWMKENNIDALRTNNTSYVWPDALDNGRSKTNAILLYKKPSNNYKIVDVEKSRAKTLKSGCQHITLLPALYNCIVKKSVLESVYSIGSTFFPGPSPDMSNAVSNSFFTKKFVMSDMPVVISGSSVMTGGGVFNKTRGKGILPLKDVPFINQHHIDNWECDFPKVWVGRLVWPESAVKALKYCHRQDLVKTLDRNRMYALTMLYYPSMKEICFSYAPNKVLFLKDFLNALIKNGTRVLKNKMVSILIPSYSFGRISHKNVKSIIEAEEILFSVTKELKFE